MELTQYLKLLQKWWWLIIIAAVLAGGVSYVRSRSVDPVYQAQVKIFIGGYLQDPNPGGGAISTGANLAITYGNIVKFRPILETTIQNLGLQMSPGALASQITTGTLPDTSILIISVTNGNPVQAANIANELANQLVSNSPTQLTPEDEDRRELLQDELQNVGTSIRETRTKLSQTQELLNTAVSESEIARLDEERDALAAKIVDYQTILADLTSALLAMGTPVNTLQIVEPALIPTAPVGGGTNRNTLIAAAASAVLAFGVALVIEYFDDTLHSPDQVREALKLQVLAGIVKFGNKKDTYKEKIITLHAPNSTPVEGYRALRTNLLYGIEGKKTNRLIVTSANISEGKSVTAANLAVALAQAGLNTVLIDADLRRPRMHNSFMMENRIGLSTLFKANNYQAADLFSHSHLSSIMQPTEIPNLKIITSGPIPANPAELLGLPHLPRLCRSLEEYMGVDMIVFDTPPVLAVIDSMTLASNIGASAIFVIDATRTRRGNAVRVVEQFDQVGVPIAGAVLNRITSQTDGYYYYYNYGRYGYSNNGKSRSNGKK